MKEQDKWDMKKLPIMPPEFDSRLRKKWAAASMFFASSSKIKMSRTSSTHATRGAKVN